MKQLLKLMPKNVAIIGALLLVIAALLLLKMKNFSKYLPYIFVALGGIAIGITGTKMFTKKCETIYLPSETVTIYRDTCIESKIIADVTSETFEDVSTEVKKGKTKTDVSKAPVESIVKQDSIYTTNFVKDYDFGLMKIHLKTTVKAASAATAEHFIEYQLDTLILKKMVNTTSTVVISEGKDDSKTETTKYLPMALDAPKETWIGLGGSIMSTPNGLKYDAGINTRFNKTSVGLFKDPTTDFGKIEGYRIQITRDLLRMSKN